MKKQIEFKDLNTTCKIGVIGGWFVLILYGALFLLGMLSYFLV
jgi:hypothetical protein